MLDSKFLYIRIRTWYWILDRTQHEWLQLIISDSLSLRTITELLSVVHTNSDRIGVERMKRRERSSNITFSPSLANQGLKWLWMSYCHSRSEAVLMEYTILAALSTVQLCSFDPGKVFVFCWVCFAYAYIHTHTKRAGWEKQMQFISCLISRKQQTLSYDSPWLTSQERWLVNAVQCTRVEYQTLVNKMQLGVKMAASWWKTDAHAPSLKCFSLQTVKVSTTEWTHSFSQAERQLLPELNVGSVVLCVCVCEHNHVVEESGLRIINSG